jgi:hypothetical protein
VNRILGIGKYNVISWDAMFQIHRCGNMHYRQRPADEDVSLVKKIA